MLKRIQWYWRVFGVALSFIAIGIGGLFMFPLLHVVIGSASAGRTSPAI